MVKIIPAVFVEGGQAYKEGKALIDNPYREAGTVLYPYTDKGKKTDAWQDGFWDAWVKAGCPEFRVPEWDNTYTAHAIRGQQ